MDTQFNYSMDSFQVQSLQPEKILKLFKNTAKTEFTGTLMRDFLTHGVSKDLRVTLNGSKFFWGSHSPTFSTLLDELPSGSSPWQKEEVGSAKICNNSKQQIGVGHQFYYPVKGGVYRLQQFSSVVDKVQSNVFYELAFSVDSTGTLPLDLLLCIWSNLPADSLLKFTSVSKTWKNLIKNNLTGLFKSYNRQKKHFVWITKPPGLVSRDSQLHSASYNTAMDSMDINRRVWSPTISCNILDGQIIGSVNGIIAVADCAKVGSGIADPVTVFNPFTKLFRKLPPMSYRYSKNLMYVSGFGYCANQRSYSVMRILYTGRPGLNGNRGKVIVCRIDFEKELGEASESKWQQRGLVPPHFGKFSGNGLYVKSMLYFIDDAGLVASYDFDGCYFSELIEPGVFIGEREHRQSSVLAKIYNKLAVIIMNYADRKLCVLQYGNTGWEPVVSLKMAMYYSITPLSILSDRLLFVADDNRIMSRLFEEEEDKVMVAFSDTFIAEFVEHSLGLTFL